MSLFLSSNRETLLTETHHYQFNLTIGHGVAGDLQTGSSDPVKHSIVYLFKWGNNMLGILLLIMAVNQNWFMVFVFMALIIGSSQKKKA